MRKKYKVLLIFAVMIFFLLPTKHVYAQDAGGTYHYLAIGNSIAKHPITDFWWGEWGMAATSPEQDYVHQVAGYLRQYNSNVSVQSVYAAAWERSSSKSSMLSMFDGYMSSDLDLVTIQLGENVLDNTNADADLKNLVAYVQQRAPKAQIIIVGSFWENNLQFDAVKRNVAAACGLEYVDISAVRSWRAGVGTVVSGADGAQHVITNQAVGEHPNDAAMKYIADRIDERIHNVSAVDYSAVYDYDHYLAYNPDLAAVYTGNPAGAFQHFLTFGMNEGRRANREFDLQTYKNNYADLRSAFGDDNKQYYLHYINFGKAEGRSAYSSIAGTTVLDGVNYAAVYDYDYYINNNPDVAAAYPNDDIAVLRHFVAFGMNEGRQAIASFNVKAYRAKYKDLRQAFGENLAQYYQHYMNFGRNEGRTATGDVVITDGITVYNGVDYAAVYNYSYYVEKNPDVAAAYPNDDIKALEHFVTFGMNEGRQSSKDFNLKSYRARYRDLRQAFGENLAQYYQHYMACGKAEGRNATGDAKITDGVTVYNGVDYAAVYNYTDYIAKNPDVAAAYPDDDVKVLEHFAVFGIHEGRQAKTEFNPSIYRANYLDLQAAYGDDWARYYEHYMMFGKAEGRNAVSLIKVMDGADEVDADDENEVESTKNEGLQQETTGNTEEPEIDVTETETTTETLETTESTEQ